MYSASKAALASYTDSLCMELRRHHIRVCLFEPVLSLALHLFTFPISCHYLTPWLSQGDMRPGQPTTYDDVTAADKAAMQVPGCIFCRVASKLMFKTGVPLRRCMRMKRTAQTL